MNPQVKKGLGLAKKGLRVMKGGQTAFRLGGKLKHLLPFRKKAAAKTAIKALKKEERQLRKSERKTRGQMQRKLLRRTAKAAGRVVFALRKRYF